MSYTLHMPGVEMMTFDGDPLKYWTFLKAFDNSISEYNVDEHAKLARLLQYCKGRANTESSKAVLPSRLIAMHEPGIYSVSNSQTNTPSVPLW